MSDRRSLWFAGMLAGVAVWLAGAAVARGNSVSFTSEGTCSHWAVPIGVSRVAINAVGGAGAAGSSLAVAQGGIGGLGDAVTRALAVTRGETLDVCVAVGGGQGASGGGSGGGASGVSTAPNFSAPVIVAAGGGGGGAGAVLGGGAGGSGDSPGGTVPTGSGGSIGGGSPTTTSGPGAGGAGAGGGGGGGGGYVGGGGGSATLPPVDAGGGAGGSNYCPDATCTTPVTTSAPAAVTVTYTVASPPTIRLTFPESGAVYVRGQPFVSEFGCADGAGGPGIVSCTDQNGRASDHFVDTSTLGTHVFTVRGASKDGLVTTAIARYRVAPRATLNKLRIRHGIITFTVTVHAGGVVAAIATTGFKRSPVYGGSKVSTTRSGKVPMIVVPSRAGRLLLGRHRRVTIRLVVTYTASGGLPQTVAKVTREITR